MEFNFLFLFKFIPINVNPSGGVIIEYSDLFHWLVTGILLEKCIIRSLKRVGISSSALSLNAVSGTTVSGTGDVRALVRKPEISIILTVPHDSRTHTDGGDESSASGRETGGEC